MILYNLIFTDLCLFSSPHIFHYNLAFYVLMYNLYLVIYTACDGRTCVSSSVVKYDGLIRDCRSSTWFILLFLWSFFVDVFVRNLRICAVLVIGT